MKALVFLLCLLVGAAHAHGLSPTRVQAPSGSKFVAYRFTATNGPAAQIYAIECFKGGYANPFPCKFAPPVLLMSANAKRSFKVQIEPDGDDLYLVCTRQEPRYETQLIVTRVCARFGVGVPASTQPNNNRINPTTESTPVSTRARPS